MRLRVAAALVALAVGAAPPARAVEVSAERFEALERRVGELEDELAEERARRQELEQQARDQAASDADGAASWADRVRLSGSANVGYLLGEEGTPIHDANFQVWDARFFVDADLGRDVVLGETPVARNLGFSFEWNLVRLGDLRNDVGDAYFEAQGVNARSWLNVQVGRFQIPVGENYLRFGKGYRDNPFISNTVGGPWWWDEGLRLYGSAGDGRLGWVTSITDGETDFSDDARRDPQFTAKLWARPASWLYLSASALRSGQVGSTDDPAQGALWLGETWATAFGSFSGLPNYQDGVPVPDGPPELDDTTLFGADAVLTHARLGRLWLAWGRYAIDSAGPGFYDRDLQYWIAEWVLEGRGVAPELAPFWLALRANGLGTYDRDEGYVLDVRSARTFGYNVRALEAYSIALGWRLTRWSTLRFELTHEDVDLVRGVPDAWRDVADHSDYLGVEVGVAF